MEWLGRRDHGVNREVPDPKGATRTFPTAGKDAAATHQVLEEVYEALREKGYNPVTQIVGYLLSGDPAYITSHRNARSLIRQMERDELLEELVKSYLGRA